MPYLVADFHHAYPTKPGPHTSFHYPEDWSPEPVVARMLSLVRIEDDTSLEGRDGVTELAGSLCHVSELAD